MKERIRRKLQIYPLSVASAFIIVGMVGIVTVMVGTEYSQFPAAWKVGLYFIALITAAETFINWIYGVK